MAGEITIRDAGGNIFRFTHEDFIRILTHAIVNMTMSGDTDPDLYQRTCDMKDLYEVEENE